MSDPHDKKLHLPVLQSLSTTSSVFDLLDDNLPTQASPSSIIAILAEPASPAIPIGGKVPRDHISYSEIACWLECNFRHMLKYLESIDLDGPSIHTEFGQVVHDVLEEFLKTRVVPDLELARQSLTERFTAINESPAPREWHDVIPTVMAEIPGFMDVTFPGWEFIASEQELLELIPNETKTFKGYIDGVIRVPKKARKGSKTTTLPPVFEYWIIDWKTCSYFWNAEKRQDFKKQLQLVLYKHFYAKKFGIDPDLIRCGFVLLSRTGKTKCQFVPVSVGPKTAKRGEEIMMRMLGSVRKGFFPKNRDSCKYCLYHKTQYCP